MSSDLSFSCFDIVSLYAGEIKSNRSFLELVLSLLAIFMIFLFIYVRVNPSDRRANILFQDVMRNTAISFLMMLGTPLIISLFCLTFAATIPGIEVQTAYSTLIESGSDFMATLENSIISTIRNYREISISQFGPNSIKFTQINRFNVGTIIIPQNDAPTYSLFLRNANDAIGGLNTILVSIAVQRFIIELLTVTNLFVVVLIIALIIRIIPGLRQVGDFAYSITLAIFILLPFLYTAFTYPFYSNPDSFNLCQDIKDNLLTKYPGFSFKFLTPISCEDLSLIEVYTVYALFIPNLVLGITFSFASNFKKIFDIFDIGG